jgi:hypothetical protein
MAWQEKFLHHIWDERHLLPDLATVSGKKVVIIYQGQYNHANGPDFRHVVISMAGEALQGDVEIHQTTADWIAHSHQEDPTYNGTILHVVYEHKGALPFTVKEDGSVAEILELKNQIDADIAKLLLSYQGESASTAHRTCDYFLLADVVQVNSLLQNAGRQRFERKCQRYNAELLLKGFDQLLYEGIMEAMGYDKNKYHSLALAHRFTWETLLDWHSQGLNSNALAGIWLHYSGLLSRLDKLVPPQLASAINRAFEYQNFTAEKSNLAWNLFRIRPANHPVLRICQASILVEFGLSRGLLTTMLKYFEQNERPKTSTLTEFLKQLFTQPGGNVLPAPGSGLLLLMAGNILLPILHLYAAKTNNLHLRQQVCTLYEQFPPLPENSVTHFMHRQMNEEKQKLAKSGFIQQQGLHYLYYRYCQYHMCELCLQEKHQTLERH